MLDTHIPIKPSILYFGAPVVLVVTSNLNGSANITPISSAWALGDRVVLGFGSVGKGISNLLRTGECTLNFPTANLWENVERIARTTGLTQLPDEKLRAGYIHACDKFALGGFNAEKSRVVSPPRIKQCALQMEAKSLACHHSVADGGAEPPPYRIVEMSVLQVHAAPEIVIPGTNHIDTAHWNPLLYVFRHYFGNSVDLGRNFRAET